MNLYSLANSKADNIKDYIIEDEGYDAENPGRPDNEHYNKSREEFNKKLIDGYFQNVDEEGNPTWKLDNNIIDPGSRNPSQDPKFLKSILKSKIHLMKDVCKWHKMGWSFQIEH